MKPRPILAPALFFSLAAILLVTLPRAIANRASDYDWFDPILEIRRHIMQSYVDAPDDDDLHTGTIEGMLGALNDPYTQFIPPADTTEFNKQLRGTYAGIGAEVNQRDGYLMIVSPMEESPALRAGILAGDLVIEIEGVSTYQKPIQECINLLTGEAGTPVTVKVRHLDGTEQTITLVREHIITRTVRGLWRVGDQWSWCLDGDLGIAYVRITQFNASTAHELADALSTALATSGLNGLVLDLRDNPGGGLPVAVAVADLFLPSGTIVSIHPRMGTGETFRASAPGTLPDFPMVILVNGNSASASEIVAGALQEAGRAKVLGTRTFGKGSVQEVRPLEYGAGTLKLTTAYYHLPSGRIIHRRQDATTWGVDPDPGFVVAVSDADYRAMMRNRREFEIIRARGVSADGAVDRCASVDWIRGTLADTQLAVAAEVLSSRLRGEPWPTAPSDDPAQTAFRQEIGRATAMRMHLYQQLEELERRIEQLEGVAAEAGAHRLIPEGVDLAEGTIEVRDRAGAIVGTFIIEGGDVGLALRTLDLTPAIAGPAGPGVPVAPPVSPDTASDR